jgi:hypothetical protein
LLNRTLRDDPALLTDVGVDPLNALADGLEAFVPCSEELLALGERLLFRLELHKEDFELLNAFVRFGFLRSAFFRAHFPSPSA